ADARRASRGTARTQTARPALRLAARDGAGCRGCRLADRGSPRRVPPTHRSVKGDGDGWRCRPHGSRHAEDAEMTAGGPALEVTVIVMRKTPVPGRVKTRLCPPCTPGEAARIATASLDATLAAVAASRARSRTLALDGMPGPWVRDGIRVIPQ